VHNVWLTKQRSGKEVSKKRSHERKGEGRAKIKKYFEDVWGEDQGPSRNHPMTHERNVLVCTPHSSLATRSQKIQVFIASTNTILIGFSPQQKSNDPFRPRLERAFIRDLWVNRIMASIDGSEESRFFRMFACCPRLSLFPSGHSSL
jgi:hypothetical protein